MAPNGPKYRTRPGQLAQYCTLHGYKLVPAQISHTSHDIYRPTSSTLCLCASRAPAPPPRPPVEADPTPQSLARQITLIINALEGVDICTAEGKIAMKELRETHPFVPRDPTAIASVQSPLQSSRGSPGSPRGRCTNRHEIFERIAERVLSSVVTKGYIRWPHVRRHIISSKDEQHVSLAVCGLCGAGLGQNHTSRPNIRRRKEKKKKKKTNAVSK